MYQCIQLFLLRYRPVLVGLVCMVLLCIGGELKHGEQTSLKPVLAQTPTPVLTDPGPVIPFPLTGFDEEVVLQGPIGMMEHSFKLPESWRFTADGSVQLGLTTFFNIGKDFPYTEGNFYAGKLQIEYNNEQIGEIPLDGSGTQTHTIAIPLGPLENPSRSGYHTLSVHFVDGLDCDFDIQSFVTINPGSQFVLPHVEGSPTINMQKLPHPIFQDTFLPDAAVLVVPDQPSEMELQAALAIAAGFGRMTNGQLDLTLKTISTMTDRDYQQNHMILVGRAEQLPLLSLIENLPVSVGPGGALQSTNVLTDDGVIQMVVSPWNTTRVVLVVGGNTDAGVLKAGQAISSGVFKATTGPNNDVAVVADVREHLENSVMPHDDMTLAEMGYDHVTREQAGQHYAEFMFYVPPGYMVSDSAYIDLIYNHSALLNFEQSGIALSLNYQTIGSAVLNEESTRRMTMRISLPHSEIHVGNNALGVSMVLVPSTNCLPADVQGVWGKIWSDSLLHIPLEPISEGRTPPSVLNHASRLLLASPTMEHVAFVVPRNQPVAWNVATQVAYFFGRSFEGDIFEATTIYADAIPESIAQEYNWVLVGRASTLPVITSLRSALPIPFDDQGDIATSQGSRIIYRFPDEVSLGYIQLFPLPDNKEHVGLALMGSNDPGLEMALNAFVQPNLSWQLAGNFAVVRDEEIVTGDTRMRSDPQEITATLVPTSTITTVPLTETIAQEGLKMEDISTDAEPVQRPGWIVPAIGVLTIMIVLLLMTVGMIAFLRHRSAKKSQAYRRPSS